MDRLAQTEAHIYLADQRGRSQTTDFRSFHTFNFGDYQHESRQPLGALTVFNDTTLLPGKSHPITVDEPTEMLLIPVVGGIEMVDGFGESVFWGAGEVFRLEVIPGQEFLISNPFESEAVNYLQIGLKTEKTHREISADFPLRSFQLENRNQLLPFFASPNQSRLGFIGKYTGRHDGVYGLSDPQKRVFVFVIEGAFEVQGRLLHPRDGLALWNLTEVEFEALSNDAILLLLEVN
ncbi:pirin family protein [Larkinella rosea]|uniref:Pirin n=1 Tax=Larkinella rosea TaxID=2025312 RepID=A0A3P1BP19_9BACT|nr:pirin [Larkinella rosea]RRB02880.1 pirin [Larkinella rosea]